MKFIAIILCVACVSCAPKPEEVAQNLITDWLYKNLDDPSSYESVEFGKLDTVTGPHFAEIRNGNMWIGNKSYQEIWDEVMGQGSHSDGEETKATPRNNLCDDIGNENMGIGPNAHLQMWHSYRISYPQYGKKLRKAIFCFDRDLTRVDSVRMLKITTL